MPKRIRYILLVFLAVLLPAGPRLLAQPADTLQTANMLTVPVPDSTQTDSLLAGSKKPQSEHCQWYYR